MNLRTKVMAGSAVALVGAGIALGIAMNPSHTPAPRTVVVQQVAATSAAPTTAVSSATPKHVAPVVSAAAATVKPAAPKVQQQAIQQEASPVSSPTDTQPAQPADPASDNPNVVTSIANGPGVTAPPAPNGQFVPGSPGGPPPAPIETPSPTESSSAG